MEDAEELDAESDGEDGKAIVPPQDDSTMTFSQHKGEWSQLDLFVTKVNTSGHLWPLGSVFSVSVDQSGMIACSGGEDDQGLVWKTSDGSVLFQCQGREL